MYINLFKTPLKAEISNKYKNFLSSVNLLDEEDAEIVALMRDEELNIVACGARSGHVLKQFGVSPDIESGGACASIMSELLNDAMREGISRLFLCTKPQNKAMFSSLGFYQVIETRDAVLMENRRNGFEEFLDETKKVGEDALSEMNKTRKEKPCSENDSSEGEVNNDEVYNGEVNNDTYDVGAIVMNGNPFTLGHLNLVEYAASKCDLLYLFVVSDKAVMKESFGEANGNKTISFTPEERYEMIVKGTSHIKNCVVRKSEAYLVSRATFPAYFVRDEEKAEEVRTDLDIELFAKRIAPTLNITKRFVGQEPFSPITKAYNEKMKKLLPEKGIELIEIPRFEGISASKVRALIEEGKVEEVKALVPETTFEMIKTKYCK